MFRAVKGSLCDTVMTDPRPHPPEPMNAHHRDVPDIKCGLGVTVCQRRFTGYQCALPCRLLTEGQNVTRAGGRENHTSCPSIL